MAQNNRRTSSSKKQRSVREEVHKLLEGMAAGSPLPSERALAQQFDVARMTLRSALEDLVDEGLLVRVPGRGLFVGSPKLAYPVDLTSFTDQTTREGRVASSRTLSFTIEPAGERLARMAHVDAEELFLKAGRLRLVDGEPMGIERVNVPAWRVPGITAEDLERHSFYHLLETRWDTRVHSGTRAAAVVSLSDENAELLRVDPGSAAFQFEERIESEDGALIEFTISTYRGDKYRFITSISSGA